MKLARNFLIAGIVVAVTAMSGAWILYNLTPTGRAAADASEGQNMTHTIDTKKLQTAIDTLLAQYPEFDTSVAITDIQTGKSYQYGETANYKAASVTKLITATAYLRAVETGDASLDSTVGGSSAQDQIEKMIVDSDNTAWASLNAVLANQGLQDYADSIRLTSYDATANTISTSDVALLLTKIYKGQLLNNIHTGLLLGYMKSAGLRDYIPAAITDGITVYHKAGWLEDRYNDAAILDDGQHQYALVIFSKSNSETYYSQKGQALFHSITHIVTKTFE
jgi:beta-lactamase class A